jgi:hypothetical protein
MVDVGDWLDAGLHIDKELDDSELVLVVGCVRDLRVVSIGCSSLSVQVDGNELIYCVADVEIYDDLLQERLVLAYYRIELIEVQDLIVCEFAVEH